MREAEDAPVTIDIRADWVPSTVPGANVRVGGGVSGTWWFNNGTQIYSIPAQPQANLIHHAYSMFFSDGFGFWVLKGDATNPNTAATWQPLRFDHDEIDGYSSYLCNASENRSLLCRRIDQQWVNMLLPDIYHGTTVTAYPQYGGLKGELAIFLGLVAFAAKPIQLPNVIPAMFQDSTWQTFPMEHGRADGRGVVVYVYACPPGWVTRSSTGSSSQDLKNYESGAYNAKYYR